MRNASKNTIKRVMRNAKRCQEKKGLYYDCQYGGVTKENRKMYYLFNDVGAQIYRMSKGNICNRSLKGVSKYVITVANKQQELWIEN